jgi:PAP2 superfamily
MKMTIRSMRWMLCAKIVLIALAGTGCASLPDGSGWGERATLTPGWKRVRESAANAARDPHVWVPLAGAAVFQIDNLDRRVSDWARRETPVFGSQDNAARWSDDFRTAASVAYVATVLWTPGGENADDWFENKAKGFTVGLAARGLTSTVTQTLKSEVGRERPSGSDRLSFPSGHTSAATVNTRLASRNLRVVPMSKRTRRTLDTGLLMLNVGTSWARIEAGAHYPSDTLFSMALGNFIGAFINDAFMGLDPDEPAQVTVHMIPEGAELRFHVVF